MKLHCTILSTLLISGCASHIETVRINKNTLSPEGQSIPGIIYYEPKLVKIRYEFTQLTDKEKGFLGSADDGSCKRIIQKEEIVTLADYTKPLAILHKPSPFSSTEFGVTLNNGMLASVTTKSTPQLPQLIEQTTKAIDTLMPSRAPGVPACNSGPVIASTSPISP